MMRVLSILLLVLSGLWFGQSLAASGGGSPETFEHTSLLFLHQLLLVYWIGPDIAVFIWSRLAVNAQMPVEQRLAAGKMMLAIDVVPKICLSLFLTVAGLLSETYGVSHPWWQMAGIVLLGPVWLVIVVLAWRRDGTELGATMQRFDTWLRMALVVGIPLSVAYSTLTDRMTDTPWISAKLILLALILLLSVLMRGRLQGFFDGLRQLEANGQSPEVDQQMASGLGRARPMVHGMWLLILAAALLGVVKPGEPEASPAVATASQLQSQSQSNLELSQPR